jgi:molybdate transport system substrate-binding protein
MQFRVVCAILLAACLVAPALVVAAPASAAELTLSAAISLKEVIEDLGRRFVQSHPGTTLRYNFGASGELAKQIEAGAPIDLFVSAAERQMDDLAAKGLIVPETRRVFARNVLTVIAPAGSGRRLSQPRDLLERSVTRIAIGNPKTVPVGQYAEESLRALGLWDALGPKLVFAENARQVLEYVVRGEVEAGVVYVTDVAVRATRVQEAFRPPESSYRPVVYPAAVVRDARARDLARAFVEHLTTPDAQTVLARHGFLAPAAR